MNKEVMDSVKQVVYYIKNSDSYKKVIFLKNKMSNNSDISDIIEDIKKKQKSYVKSGFSDETLKQELTILEKRLFEIPIYNEYNKYLKEVNDMIDLIRDELNNYFFELLKS